MIPRLLIFFFMLILPAPGDGGFRSSHLLKAVPIPQQTAVMWHQDGKETLTIWNTVEAETQELAWVLPLPAAPEVIQETDASALRMIRMLCAPEVITGGSDGLLFISRTFPISLLILMSLWLLAKRRRWDAFGGIGCLPWMAIVVIVAHFILFQGYSKIMGGGGLPTAVSGVSVLREQTAGSYDTTVISGTSAAAVNRWLTGHGFAAFEGRDLKVLEDYIARKWVLFCARISTGGNGVKETHPLTVRFPAAQPVYPMRLTESAGAVPVDLFVIGGNFVRDPSGRLETWSTLDFSTKRFFHNIYALSTALEHEQEMREDNKEGAEKRRLPVEYLPFVPAGRDVFLDTLMTGGTHVTHLKHTFKPGEDWNDIQIVPTTESAPARNYITLAGYLEQILTGLGLAPAILLFLVAALAHWRAEWGQRPHRAWGFTMGVLLMVAWTGTALFTWKNVSIVPSERVVSSRSRNAESGHGQFMIWMNKLSAPPEVTSR